MKVGTEGDAIQGALDAVIFNPIASAILKWLKFKVVSWMHEWFGIGNSSHDQQWFGAVSQGMYFTKGHEVMLNK
jgi:hypothetical protein